MTEPSEHLPPYSGEDVTCPKCRGNVHTSYYPPGTRFVAPSMVKFARGHDEWLLRSCGSCSYSWPEACADAHASTMFEQGDTP